MSGQPLKNGRANVVPKMLAQHQFVCSPNIAIVGLTSAPHRSNIGMTLDQHSADIVATLGQRFGDVGPTIFANDLPSFWSPFCQLFSDLSPTFSCWYSYIMFPILNIDFDVLRISRKYYIPMHVLVPALKHDIPMTSSRHQGIWS